MSTKDVTTGHQQSDSINHNHSNSRGSSSADASITSIALRLYWMIGWALPLLLISRVAFDKTTSGAMSFTLYLALWISMVAAKYVDVFKLKGSTADGKPATASHFYQYIIQTLIFFLILALASTVFKK
ncbi:MAG: hypothetical protein HQK50_14445 [Oligoflexia bacterium]|nr:hypothetical protein [Oligoflexia bacterium]MBF0366770.1 hypothetical protein [Oligoflexia bacterium]